MVRDLTKRGGDELCPIASASKGRTSHFAVRRHAPALLCGRGAFRGQYAALPFTPLDISTAMNLHEYQVQGTVRRATAFPCRRRRREDRGGGRGGRRRSLGGNVWVVKAQVHAGGRGKAGGVKLAKTPDEVEQHAEAHARHAARDATRPALTACRSTRATSSGLRHRARAVPVAARRPRARSASPFIASAAGGMDIEEVARDTPEKILHADVHSGAGLQPYQCRKLGFGLGLNAQAGRPAARRSCSALYKLFNEQDASLVELNPLDRHQGRQPRRARRQDQLRRQRDLPPARARRDARPAQEDATERCASEHDLNYVTLDGNIGCMVNGAGLAMATMDLIKLHGGEPANFLDVGGGATKERVTEAFKLILSNEKVRAILVNIFGGIVRCDMIAEGIIAAVKEVGVKVPVVVRLEGTNVDKGARAAGEQRPDDHAGRRSHRRGRRRSWLRKGGVSHEHPGQQEHAR